MRRSSFKRSLINVFVLLILSIVVLGVPFHYWTVDQKKVLQTVFPVIGFFSSDSISCSSGSPDWQKDVMNFGVWQLRAPASQTAFIDREGALHHCESGWEGALWFSSRVSVDSKFQFGSLTKPITSSLIIDLVNQGMIRFDTSVVDIFEAGRRGNAKDSFEKVTVDNLLKYKAGVSGDVFLEHELPWCPYEMAKIFEQRVWIATIGEHRYDNLNYCILGAVASDLYGTNFREAMYERFDLGSIGLSFVDAPSSKGWVYPDYRYHQFYRDDIQPSFDYYAISSTAGLGGSASGYALLISRLIESNVLGFRRAEGHDCDTKTIRNCYDRAFYIYEAKNGETFNIKEGYMPGFSSFVLVNSDGEVFVWLGNSDTPDARDGKDAISLLDIISESSF